MASSRLGSSIDWLNHVPNVRSKIKGVHGVRALAVKEATKDDGFLTVKLSCMLINLVWNLLVLVLTTCEHLIPVVSLQIETVDLSLLIVLHQHRATDEVHVLADHE